MNFSLAKIRKIKAHGVEFRSHLDGSALFLGPKEAMEIFFSHDAEIRGHHILLVEGLVHSGITSEFLMSDLLARGAASVKLATLLDRQTARRVQVQPDYFVFLVDEAFIIGYGLGSPEQTNRNLPHIASQA